MATPGSTEYYILASKILLIFDFLHVFLVIFVCILASFKDFLLSFVSNSNIFRGCSYFLWFLCVFFGVFVCFLCVRGKFTLKDALDYLEELIDADVDADENIDAIYLEPPDNEGFESGEDDTTDDDWTNNPDAICAAQLKSGCELALRNGERITDFEDEIEIEVIPEHEHVMDVDDVIIAEAPTMIETSEDMIDLANGCAPRRSLRSAQPLRPVLPKEPKYAVKNIDLGARFKWIEDKSTAQRPIFPEANYEDCVGLKPHEQFEKIFDEETLQYICDCSNLYATKENKNYDPIRVDGKRIVIDIFRMHLFLYFVFSST